MKSQYPIDVSNGNSPRPVNYGKELLSQQGIWTLGNIMSVEVYSPSEQPVDSLDMLFPETMLASEDVLKRDWDTPTEDNAWAHL